LETFLETHTSPNASFTRMDESTQQDWQIIGSEFMQFAKGLPDRVLAHLKLLEGDYGGFPIDRFSHCLQTATLALKDGRSDEYITCALLHDIGDTLGSFNHPEIAAAILKPFVSEGELFMVQNHGIFQGYNFFHYIGLDRNLRDSFKTSPYYSLTEEFVELYDNRAFDATMEIYPLSEFEPIVRRVMAQPKRSIYKAALDKM
jgi:predicted HD phosphohydrolase